MSSTRTRRSPVTSPAPAPAPAAPAPEPAPAKAVPMAKPDPAPTPAAPTYPRADWEKDLAALAYSVLRFPRINGRASLPLIAQACRDLSELSARCASADHTWSIKCGDNITRNPAALVGWFLRESVDAKARTADIRAYAARHTAK